MQNTLAMFNIFKNIALFFVLPTCRGSLTEVGALSSFDFYNKMCQANCDGDYLNDLDFFINPCPKCSEKYANVHCDNW